MSVAIRSHLLTWLLRWLQIEDLKQLGRVELEVRSQTLTRIEFAPSDNE